MVIDRFSVDPETSIVVRAEDGGDRNFVELHEHGALKWRALTPTYAGRPGAPGIAWNDIAISVRVIRDGRAEIFALARETAAKLGGFKLAPGKGVAIKQSTGPVTLLLPKRAISVISAPGQKFNDPEADRALFESLKSHLRPGLEVIEMDAAINDPAFAEACVRALLKNMGRGH